RMGDWDEDGGLMEEALGLRGCRDALRAFFAGMKADLVERRCHGLDLELDRLGQRLAALDDKETGQRNQRDEIKRAIAENGGDRLESPKREINRKGRLEMQTKG